MFSRRQFERCGAIISMFGSVGAWSRASASYALLPMTQDSASADRLNASNRCTTRLAWTLAGRINADVQDVPRPAPSSTRNGAGPLGLRPAAAGAGRRQVLRTLVGSVHEHRGGATKRARPGLTAPTPVRR